MDHRIGPLAAGLAFALALHLSPAVADDDAPELGWAQSVELSLVSTSGNAESDTLGMAAAFVNTMPEATLTFTANALRAESTATSRTAIGSSPADFVVRERSTSMLTAEKYAAGARFDRAISDTFFWYTGATFEKNEFAGFSERITGVAGVGNQWWDRDDSRFRTDYGLTWTTQDDLVPNPAIDDSFLGARLAYDYWRQLTASAEYGSTLVVDQNLDESEDLRGDFVNWLAVSLSDHLALKVSLQLLYDNLPALGVLPLQLPDGMPTGDLVTFELDDTDTILTTALVLSF